MPFPGRLATATGIVALMLLVAVVDVFSGSEIRVYPLYFVPIALTARRFPGRAVYAAAALCAMLWTVSNAPGLTHHGTPWVWVWNAFVQAVAFMLVAWLVAHLQDALARARESARVDNLTGLRNVRAFHEQAPLLVDLCRRQGQPLALAYIDLDGFKQVNDRQGHARGDEILSLAARVMRDGLRASDLLARIGGDEFAALLPNATEAGVGEILERLRGDIEASMRATGCAVTASIGAIAADPAPADWETMLHAADGLMYGVKKAGKNRVKVQAFVAGKAPAP